MILLSLWPIFLFVYKDSSGSGVIGHKQAKIVQIVSLVCSSKYSLIRKPPVSRKNENWVKQNHVTVILNSKLPVIKASLIIHNWNSGLSSQFLKRLQMFMESLRCKRKNKKDTIFWNILGILVDTSKIRLHLGLWSDNKYTYLCLYQNFPNTCGTWLFISVIIHCKQAMPTYFSSVLHPLLVLYSNIQVWLKNSHVQKGASFCFVVLTKGLISSYLSFAWLKWNRGKHQKQLCLHKPQCQSTSIAHFW